MKVTDHELDRRRRIADATRAITEIMGEFAGTVGELTALEWVKVFTDLQGRAIGLGLHEEWQDERGTT